MDDDRQQHLFTEHPSGYDRRIELGDPRQPMPHPLLLLDEELRAPSLSDYAMPLGLFLVTVFTTLWAGAYQTNTNPFTGAWSFLVNNPAVLWDGVPFAATLLGILVTHEMGHYVLSRIHGVPTTLPLFIPGPPHFIGTFGAIIRMRSPILNRKALFDIGVAGPIAGFVVALAALMIGLSLSKVVEQPIDFGGVHLGPSLLVSLSAWAFFDSIPQGFVLNFHPIADAAWFGLFVTALNLIPIGQLDGGHVAYALWGRRQRIMALAMVPILIALGFAG
ncbi:MAG: site-2 protease family protein, partial [Nitrospiraceae bacterium]